MATMETTERARTKTPVYVGDRTTDETKHSLKTTEFWAMAGLIVAILVASAYLRLTRRCPRLDARRRGRDRLHDQPRPRQVGHQVRRRRRPAQQPLDARQSGLCSGAHSPRAQPHATAWANGARRSRDASVSKNLRAKGAGA